MVIIPLVDYRMTLRCRSNAAQGNKKDKCKPGRDWKALMSLYKSLRLHLKHWVQFLAAPVEGEKKKTISYWGKVVRKVMQLFTKGIRFLRWGRRTVC